MKLQKMENKLNIKKLFKKLKISKDDTIMLHGDAGIFAQYKKKKDPINSFYNQLIKFVGKNGNILVPTFTTSFCKKKFFNVETSKSETGLFSEKFRVRTDTKRTEHPIFSFSIHGNKWKHFDKSNIETCFGDNSLFQLFNEMNGKILILGSTFENVTTFVHYIEQCVGVNYRYLKKFSGIIVNKNKIKLKVTTSYFVRNLKKNKKLKTPNKLYQILNKVRIGRYEGFSINSKKLFNHCLKNIKKNHYYLVN